MIKGLVQGVGFRPFIFRLAEKHGLYGEVDNRSDGISVILQCDENTASSFGREVLINAPPASQIKSIEINKTSVNGYNSFRITKSERINDRITEISPDIAVCDECLSDMNNDPSRIDYPFINCTNCGPRFTIINDLPYDRHYTSMKSFPMCEKCYSEYNDVNDRRFHAQPIACNSCGPVYVYSDQEKILFTIKEIINEIVLKIKLGKTIAIKGIGGYFLMCDALNNKAVTELRRRKNRDSKPFAVMFRDLEALKEFCYVNDAEEKELVSWHRPIVILRRKKSLAYSVNNGLNTTGAMLPYMPVHYLLFRSTGTPVVVLTSGNISDEPIITDDDVAAKKLKVAAFSLVTYNRRILNRADDSVVRVYGGKPGFIRRSRGYVPRPFDLDLNVNGILALGAEQKSTFCIGKNHQAIMSQYIGDIKNNDTFEFFKDSIKKFSKLYRFSPEMAVCDLHPDYLSTLYGESLHQRLGIPVVKMQHHHAHIVSCLAEYGLNEKVTGICLDGTGYGNDGCIWGGEFMIADMEKSERYLHFDYVPMPGGEKAILEPWRMAFSYLFKYFGENIDYQAIPVFKAIEKHKLVLLKEMILSDINSPLSSGAGRLFDAVSALLGLCSFSSFDSEAPMRLESAIDSDTDEYYPFTIDGSVVFSDTLECILSDIKNESRSVIPAKFHNTIARLILEVSGRIRDAHEIEKVVLTGGVFQNKYLYEKTENLLIKNGFMVLSNRLVPSNDGGISLGQLAFASKIREKCV